MYPRGKQASHLGRDGALETGGHRGLLLSAVLGFVSGLSEFRVRRYFQIASSANVDDRELPAFSFFSHLRDVMKDWLSIVSRMR